MVLPPATSQTTAAPPTSLDVYRAWLAFNNEHATYGREAIDPADSASYGFIWQSWCRFIAARRASASAVGLAPWQQAQADDIAAFLHSGMRRLKHGKPTNTAKRRYWRVLSRVYDYAHAQDWVVSNPVVELTDMDTPKTEKPVGACLTPALYDACIKSLPPLYGSATEARDRAMFLLLLVLGLTPQEVRELRVQDLERDRETGRVLFVNVPALRSHAQQRRMAVDERTSQALLHWLGQRPLLTSLRPGSVSSRAGTGRIADPLFVSQKSPQVTMGTLLHVCHQLIKSACARTGQPLPAQMGPQVLRNTVLVRWLDEGIEVGKVARMAGLKNAKGLRHLMPHVGQEVRAHLAAADKRDDEGARLG